MDSKASAKVNREYDQDISKLSRRLDELSRQIAEVERTLNRVIMNSETYLATGSEYNKNLDELTNSMHQLQVSLARSPAQYNASIEEALQPVWEKLNRHSSRFIECGEQVKQDIKTSSTSRAGFIWAAVVVFSGIVVYAYHSDRTYVIDKITTLTAVEKKWEDEIESALNSLETRIDKFHPYYYADKKDKADKK